MFTFVSSVVSSLQRLSKLEMMCCFDHHRGSVRLLPKIAIKAWTQYFFDANVWVVGLNLPTVDHQFWRNIVQLPPHALVPALEASTASIPIRNITIINSLLFEINKLSEINFDRNMLIMKLSGPLGFEICLSVKPCLPAT